MRYAMLLAGAALLGATACYEEDGLGPALTGASTQVLLTDSPFPFDSVAAVNVYIVRIDATTQDSSAGGWVTITEPRRRFNLLDLQQGVTTVVGAGELPEGNYRAIRLVMNTDSSSIVMNGGRVASVSWPARGEITMHALVERPIHVPGAGTDIVLDFDVGRSFSLSPMAPTDFHFIPWIRAVSRSATGAIVGTVRGDLNGDGTPEPIRNAAITVWPWTPDSLILWAPAATGRTDANGHFRIAFLNPRRYVIEVDPLGQIALDDTTISDIPVQAGADTRRDVVLGPRNLAYLYVDGRFVLDSGETTTLHARVGDDRGRPVPSPSVTWTSSNPSVATVTQGGASTTLRALRSGSTDVTAQSGGMQVTVSIFVTPRDSSGGGSGGGGAVASVVLSPAGAVVSVGDSLGFFATTYNASGQPVMNRRVDWAVQDTTVAWVIGQFGQSLILRAARAGTTTVIARSEGKADTALVRVDP